MASEAAVAAGQSADELRRILLNRHLDNALPPQNRPGSAPPTEGLLPGSPITTEFTNAITGPRMPAPAASSGGEAEAEQAARYRADPQYAQYYYANVKQNPRLPPPLGPREYLVSVSASVRTEPWDGKTEAMQDSSQVKTDAAEAYNMLFGSKLSLREDSVTAAPAAAQATAASLLAQSLGGAAASTRPGDGLNAAWANVAGSTSGGSRPESLLNAFGSPKPPGINHHLLAAEAQAGLGNPLFSVRSADEANLHDALLAAANSAPHTPRGGSNTFFNAVQASGAAAESPRPNLDMVGRSMSGSNLGGAGRDPQVPAGGRVHSVIGDRGHSTTRTPSKLRIGSTASSMHQAVDRQQLMQSFAAASASAASGMAASGAQPDVVQTAMEVYALQAALGTNPEDGAAAAGADGLGMPSQQMQAMYMAAAMYPYMQQAPMSSAGSMPNAASFQQAMQAMSGNSFPGTGGMMPFPGAGAAYAGSPMAAAGGYPMMNPMFGGVAGQMPNVMMLGMPGGDMGGLGAAAGMQQFGMPGTGANNMMPPFPMGPAEYAAFYQKMMEGRGGGTGGGADNAAASAMMGNGMGQPPPPPPPMAHKDKRSGTTEPLDRHGLDQRPRTGSNGRDVERMASRTNSGHPGMASGPSASRMRPPGDAGPMSGAGMPPLPMHPREARDLRGENSTRRHSGRRDGEGHHRGPGTGGDPLLEEFKARGGHNQQPGPNGKRFELRDILGHVCEFSLDQHGSRFIQQKIEGAAPEDIDAVFKEVLPRSLSLMTDVFGNYVVQKLLEHGNVDHRDRMAKALSGQVLQLSLQMYGCRVVQKALEVFTEEQQVTMVAELDGYIMRCVRDQNGNHVIQKVIECVPSVRVTNLLDNFLMCVVPLSAHPFGCRVIQRILEHCKDVQRTQAVMDDLLKAAAHLAQDQYGNYVIQHLLERGTPAQRSSITQQLAPSVVQMSMHKYASNVVEKCLAYGSIADRDLLINNMLGAHTAALAPGTTPQTAATAQHMMMNGGDGMEDGPEDPLQQMMKDQYGNYVVQKVLEVCTEVQREAMLARVRQQLHALKRYPYGKHIVSRVEKLLSAGTRYQTHARGRLLPDDEMLAAGRMQVALNISASDGLPLEDPVTLSRFSRGSAGGGGANCGSSGGGSITGGSESDVHSRLDSPGVCAPVIAVPVPVPINGSADGASSCIDGLPVSDPMPISAQPAAAH